MTLTELVRPGEKIEIQAVERAILGEKSNRKVVTSKVYDILDDETLEVLMPMDKTKLILLPVDGEYQFCFYTQKGLYQCFVRIADRYKNNNVYILLCELTSPLGKFQRREYYRYACSLPVKTRELMEEETKSIGEEHFRLQVGLPVAKGSIADISGGGIRFVTNRTYTVGEQIAIYFSLNIHGRELSYSLVGEVLSCRENENRRGEFEHRIKFTVVTHDEREEIIRYIFEQERKSRRKM